ncbi:hypothetical protein NKG05_29570 [Oerskovia sp. M15]
MTLVDDTLLEADDAMDPSRPPGPRMPSGLCWPARCCVAQSSRPGARRSVGRRLLPVPDELAACFPSGLPAGTAVVVDGSTSLLLALLSEASRTGPGPRWSGSPARGPRGRRGRDRPRTRRARPVPGSRRRGSRRGSARRDRRRRGRPAGRADRRRPAPPDLARP